MMPDYYSGYFEEEPLTPYPLWHLLFWISPHFENFLICGWFLLVSYLVSKLTASGLFSILINKINLTLYSYSPNEQIIEVNWKYVLEHDPYDPNLLIEFFQSDFYPSSLRLVFEIILGLAIMTKWRVYQFRKLKWETISNWSPKNNLRQKKINWRRKLTKKFEPYI